MKKTLILAITLIAALLPCAAEKKSDTVKTPGEISIRFFDRTMYYPGNSEDNPVLIHITVSNNSKETMHFKLADDRMFSVDFVAYTVKNNMLPMTQTLIRKRTTNQTVYFRDLSLEPGEEYSFIENVKDYLDISEPSIYYLEMRFYPNLIKDKEFNVVSNRLSLEVRPSPLAASSTMLPVEQGSAALLHREEISPDKVVEQTILARQKNLWDQFFLYMDVEQILKRDQARARKYNMMSADDRGEMLRTFKADLMQARIDRDIVAIPEKFQIENTTYTTSEGTVKVIEWFKNDTFYEVKRYTYYVRQRDGIWTIYDYVVDNLRTE